MSIKKVYAPRSKTQIKPTARDSKRGVIVTLLAKGATVAELADACGWSKASAGNALSLDVHAMLGYGLTRDTETKKYKLVFPKGLTKPLFTDVREG